MIAFTERAIVFCVLLAVSAGNAPAAEPASDKIMRRIAINDESDLLYVRHFVEVGNDILRAKSHSLILSSKATDETVIWSSSRNKPVLYDGGDTDYPDGYESSQLVGAALNNRRCGFVLLLDAGYAFLLAEKSEDGDWEIVRTRVLPELQSSMPFTKAQKDKVLKKLTFVSPTMIEVEFAGGAKKSFTVTP